MEKEIKSPTNNKNIQNLNMKNNRLVDKKDEQENKNSLHLSQNHNNPLKKMSLLGDSNTMQTNYADLRRSLTEKYPSLNSENNINKKSNTKISDEKQNLSAKSLLKVNSVVQPNSTSYNSRLKDFGPPLTNN